MPILCVKNAKNHTEKGKFDVEKIKNLNYFTNSIADYFTNSIRLGRSAKNGFERALVFCVTDKV